MTITNKFSQHAGGFTRKLIENPYSINPLMSHLDVVHATCGYTFKLTARILVVGIFGGEKMLRECVFSDISQ